MTTIDTLVILDGGAKDCIGFHAGYELVHGMESIAYSINLGLKSSHINRMYLYSDCEEKVAGIANKFFHQNLEILDKRVPFPTDPKHKILRIVPAEAKMGVSLQRTFYQYIVNDRSCLEKFRGNWREKAHVQAYRNLEPNAIYYPFAAIANDMPLPKPCELDSFIEHYEPRKHDSLWGFTKQSVRDQFLEGTGLSVVDFHPTLKKQDYINGEWMRHTCFWLINWAKIDDRAVDLITYCNQHRYQSKAANFAKAGAKVMSLYFKPNNDVLAALRDGLFFAIGKYAKNFGSSKIASFISERVTSQRISEATGQVINHRLCFYPDCGARPLFDIDHPRDVKLIEKLMDLKG